MQQKVSICIPTYNGERFLRETLESASSQSYQNLEILVVDDCSKDSSIEVVKSFQLKDDRIRLIKNKEQLGMVANWNKCISEARADWVKLQFQDDLMDTTAITKMIQFAEESQTRLVLTEREYFFEDGIRNNTHYLHRISRDYTINSVITQEYFINLLIKHGLNQNFIGEPIIGIFHKSLIDDIGYYNPSLRQIVDLDFWIRAVLFESIGYLPEPLHFFRIHRSSQGMKNRRKSVVSATIQDRLLMGSDIIETNFNGLIKDPIHRGLIVMGMKHMINRDISSVGVKHIENVVGSWALKYYQPDIWTSIRSGVNGFLNSLRSRSQL